MATPAQTLANRENAQHSTGPSTDAGKAKSSQNSTRHGLTARGLIVPLGFEQTFTKFEQSLRGHLLPAGNLEGLIFDRILECAWNLERCRRAQAQLFETTDPAVDPLLNDQIEPKLARIDKYARQYENSMFKAMRELSKIQTEAQYRNEIHPLAQEELDDPDLFERTPQSLSAVCNFTKIMAAAQRSPKRSKFQNKANALALLQQLADPPIVEEGEEPYANAA